MGAGEDELDLGGLEDEGGSDKPFDDEPFDAGVEADEDSDPKNFIQQLAGKLGQSIRQYNKDMGQPDLELEKFAINSVVSATHSGQMDSEDQKDIIKQVKTAGKGGEDDNVDINVDVDGQDADVDVEKGGEEPAPVAPEEEGGDEELDFGESVDRLREADGCWKGYEMVGMKEKDGKKVPNCVPIKESNTLRKILLDKITEHHDMDYKNYGKYDDDEYMLDVDDSEPSVDGESNATTKKAETVKVPRRKKPWNVPVSKPSEEKTGE